jgi:hypothetical protein
VEEARAGWLQVTRPDLGLTFSYPEVTPQGQTVERGDEPFRRYARIHLSSPDREELYVEIVRFDDLAPEDEYRTHRSFLDRRFGSDAVTALTETSWQGQQAWAYGFRWEGGERAVSLIQVDGETYRIIYDPRSALNSDVIATLKRPT